MRKIFRWDAYRREMTTHLSKPLSERLKDANHSQDKGPFPDKRAIELSDVYAQERTQFGKKPLLSALSSIIPKGFPPLSKLRTAVIAGGTGRFAEELSKAGIPVVYTDVSRFWVSHNKTKRGLPSTVANVHTLPFKGLDVIFAFEPWPIFDYKPWLLKEIFSASKAFVVFENAKDRERTSVKSYIRPEVRGYGIKVKTVKTSGFFATIMQPTETTFRRLEFDQVLLKKLGQRTVESFKIEELAKEMESSPQEIIAAFKRTRIIFPTYRLHRRKQ